MIKGICTFIVALALVSPAQAYQESLPKGSMLCGDKPSMDEAVKALEARDDQWFHSLPSCLITNQPLKAQRIDCEGRTCKVRVWMTTGRNATAYTLRSDLAN